MAQPASSGRLQPNRRSDMAYSGPIRPLYGGVIRDKCKTANPAVLKAWIEAMQRIDRLRGA